MALFGGFSSLFSSLFCVLVIYIYIGSQFWKKIGPSLLLADARASERKFRMPTELPTTNSTNKYPNVVELGDQLHCPSPSTQKIRESSIIRTLLCFLLKIVRECTINLDISFL